MISGELLEQWLLDDSEYKPPVREQCQGDNVYMALVTFVAGTFCGEGVCPVLCSTFSGIPGLYSLEATPPQDKHFLKKQIKFFILLWKKIV